MADFALFRFTRKSDTAESLRTGWKLLKSNAKALAGEDTIVGQGRVGVSIGSGSRLDAGVGSDIIVGNSRSGSAGELLDYGIKNRGVVLLGNGNNNMLSSGSISNKRKVEAGGGRDYVKGSNIENEGALSMGAGRDGIAGIIFNHASSVIRTGERGDTINSASRYRAVVNRGLINTGSDGDRINAEACNGPPALGNTGIEYGGIIITGDGNDAIACSGQHALENWGILKTGAGDDRITAAGLVAVGVLRDPIRAVAAGAAQLQPAVPLVCGPEPGRTDLAPHHIHQKPRAAPQ